MSNLILKKHCFLLLLLLHISIAAISDEGDGYNSTYTPQILPASPTASELGKYGYIPVSLSTGTPNINIPLYEYKSKNLSVPLSLSYYSNGIKVDQISSWVGMGWSLNAGGVVTRTIRDQPDDNGYRIQPPESFMPTWELEAYLNMCADYDEVDTEPDMFAFNFSGCTGSFVLDENFQPVFIPHQNLKIETDYLNATDGILEIKITDGKGVVYVFGGDTSAVETAVDASTGSTCGKIINMPSISSWYLSKIIHPLGDSILFSYESAMYTYETGVIQTYQEAVTTNSECGSTCVGKGGSTCEKKVRAKTLHLTEISSPGFGKITFTSDNNRPDIAEISTEARLDKITIYDENDSELKSCEFVQMFSDELSEYRMFLDTVYINDDNSEHEQSYYFEYNKDINDLPERLNYAQDHWGFYNGQTNNEGKDFVPNPGEEYDNWFEGIGSDREPYSQYSDIGLLTKITYPTGGYNNLEWEANDFHTTEIVSYNGTSVDLTINGFGPHSPLTVVDTLSIPSNQSVQNTNFKVWVTYYHADTCDTYDDSKHKGQFRLLDITNPIPNELIQEAVNCEESPHNFSEYLLPGHTYVVELIARGKCTTTKSEYTYYNQPPTTRYINKETGGQRIKKIVTDDLINSTPQTTNYYYTSLADTDESTGKLNHEPFYIRNQEIYYTCADGMSMYPCNYLMLYSSSQTNLYAYGSNFINYSHVLVSYGDNFENGGEEHIYRLSPDVAGNSIRGNHISGTPFNNTAWDNGLELYNRTFKIGSNNDTITLKKKYNYYDEDIRVNDTLYGIVVRKNWDPIFSPTETIICPDDPNDESNIRRINCDAIHVINGDTVDHVYLSSPLHPIFGWLEKYKVPWCTTPIGNFNDTIWSACHGQSGGTVEFIPTLENFDVMQYLIHSQWHYLYKDSLAVYDENGENPIGTKTNYYYDNELHANLSRSVTIDSKGDTLKSFTYYPQDYTDSIENFEYLVENHILNVPIDQRTYKNEVLTSGKLIRYNDLGQATEVDVAKNELGGELGFDVMDPYSYGDKELILHYDANNNVSNYVPENNYASSFLWGYNNAKAIANIKNASEEECFHENYEESFTPYTLDKHSGNNSFQLTSGNSTGVNAFQKSDLISGKYVLSAWVKTTGTNVNSKLMIKDSDYYPNFSVSVSDTEGEWQYFEVVADLSSGDWTNSIQCTISNTSGDDILVDDVRFHPVDAQMTSYTYDPLIGISSVSDVNSFPIHYEYDAFGRLESIKNSDGDIVEHHDYNYKNQ